MAADQTNADPITIDKAITLDLGGFALTSSAKIDIAADVTIDNGTIDFGDLGDAMTITAGNVVIGEDAILDNGVGCYLVTIKGGKLTVNGTLLNNYSGAGTLTLKGNCEVVVNDTAKLIAFNSPISLKNDNAEENNAVVTINGGLLKSTDGYPIFYNTKAYDATTINLIGGVFETANVVFNFKGSDKISVTPLDANCLTYFNKVDNKSADGTVWAGAKTVAEFCAEGYAPKQIASGDYAGYYQIARQYKVLFKVDDAKVTTNLVWAGDTTTAAPAPTVEGYIFKGWKCDDQTVAAGAEITPVADMTFVAVLEEDAKPVDPEEPSEAYDTPEQAADAAAKINDNKEKMINTPTGATPARYTSLFTAIVTADNKVVVELNENGTNAVKTAAAAIETAVATKLSNITAAEVGGVITLDDVTVEPGFWYGVAATADLTGMKTAEPATWVQATGTTLSGLTAKKPAADKGFFQTKAKATNK